MILEEMESAEGGMGEMGWQTKNRLNKLGVSGMGMPTPRQDPENPEAANHLLNGQSLSDAAMHLQQASPQKPLNSMNGPATSSPASSATSPKPPTAPGSVSKFSKPAFDGPTQEFNDQHQTPAGSPGQARFAQQQQQQQPYANGTSAYDRPQIAPFDGPSEIAELEMSRRTSSSGNPFQSSVAPPSAAWQ